MTDSTGREPAPFLLIMFMGLAHLTSMESAAYTKILNLSSNVCSMVTFLLGGHILLLLGLTASVFSIAGHYAGAGMVLKKGRKLSVPYSGSACTAVY